MLLSTKNGFLTLFKIGLYALITFFALNFLSAFWDKPQVGELTPTQANNNGKVWFIDARSHEFYLIEHIPSALSIPFQKRDEWKSTKLSSIKKDAKIIVYCDSKICGLSIGLAKFFIEEGFSNVNILKGGLDDWISQGFKTIKK